MMLTSNRLSSPSPQVGRVKRLLLPSLAVLYFCLQSSIVAPDFLFFLLEGVVIALCTFLIGHTGRFFSVFIPADYMDIPDSAINYFYFFTGSFAFLSLTLIAYLLNSPKLIMISLPLALFSLFKHGSGKPWPEQPFYYNMLAPFLLFFLFTLFLTIQCNHSPMAIWNNEFPKSLSPALFLLNWLLKSFGGRFHLFFLLLQFLAFSLILSFPKDKNGKRSHELILFLLILPLIFQNILLPTTLFPTLFFLLVTTIQFINKTMHRKTLFNPVFLVVATLYSPIMFFIVSLFWLLACQNKKQFMLAYFATLCSLLPFVLWFFWRHANLNFLTTLFWIPLSLLQINPHTLYSLIGFGFFSSLFFKSIQDKKSLRPHLLFSLFLLILTSKVVFLFHAVFLVITFTERPVFSSGNNTLFISLLTLPLLVTLSLRDGERINRTTQQIYSYLNRVNLVTKPKILYFDHHHIPNQMLNKHIISWSSLNKRVFQMEGKESIFYLKDSGFTHIFIPDIKSDIQPFQKVLQRYSSQMDETHPIERVIRRYFKAVLNTPNGHLYRL